MAEVEELHLGCCVAHRQRLRRGLAQPAAHRVQTQVALVLQRADAGHALEAGLQGAAADPQPGAEVQHTHGTATALLHQLAAAPHDVAAHRAAAARRGPGVVHRVEQVQEGVEHQLVQRAVERIGRHIPRRLPAGQGQHLVHHLPQAQHRRVGHRQAARAASHCLLPLRQVQVGQLQKAFEVHIGGQQAQALRRMQHELFAVPQQYDLRQRMP